MDNILYTWNAFNHVYIRHNVQLYTREEKHDLQKTRDEHVITNLPVLVWGEVTVSNHNDVYLEHLAGRVHSV